ncbi:MAG: hypothetical protein IPK82_41510 [Polyangiaceae bacterium]|nr:hypothetical protein [Polyangiaceae bacterium]
MPHPSPTLLTDLTIDDEGSFDHVALYADLKRVVEQSSHRFFVLRGRSRQTSWERAAFLNLTFWHADESMDVLVDKHIPADVVAHIAWHALASKHLSTPGERPTVSALLVSEAIASAFDLYLVGRLLGHQPDSEFLTTQVPQMAECAENAGMTEAAFEDLLGGVAADPEKAFEDLRALLVDAAEGLYKCRGAEQAAGALDALEDRRFSAILHHYELSNWVLYARAYGRPSTDDDPARACDQMLRKSKVALDWLEEHWVRPALDAAPREHSSRRARPR